MRAPNFPRGWWIGRLVIWSRRFGSHDFGTHMGVSKNRGTPEWMIYNGNLKSLLNWMIWGYHHFRKHPYSVFKQAIPLFAKFPGPNRKGSSFSPTIFQGRFCQSHHNKRITKWPLKQVWYRHLWNSFTCTRNSCKFVLIYALHSLSHASKPLFNSILSWFGHANYSKTLGFRKKTSPNKDFAGETSCVGRSVHTVHGRIPANQLRLVVYPIICRVLYIPGGFADFFHQRYLSIRMPSFQLPDSLVQGTADMILGEAGNNFHSPITYRKEKT